MPDYQDLRARIEELVSRRRLDRERQQRGIENSMTELERRQRRFKELVPTLIKNYLEPRLRLLEEYFPDAKCDPSPEN